MWAYVYSPSCVTPFSWFVCRLVSASIQLLVALDTPVTEKAGAEVCCRENPQQKLIHGCYEGRSWSHFRAVHLIIRLCAFLFVFLSIYLLVYPVVVHLFDYYCKCRYDIVIIHVCSNFCLSICQSRFLATCHVHLHSSHVYLIYLSVMLGPLSIYPIHLFIYILNIYAFCLSILVFYLSFCQPSDFSIDPLIVCLSNHLSIFYLSVYPPNWSVGLVHSSVYSSMVLSVYPSNPFFFPST